MEAVKNIKCTVKNKFISHALKLHMMCTRKCGHNICSDLYCLEGDYEKDAMRFALVLQSFAVFNSIIRIVEKSNTDLIYY